MWIPPTNRKITPKPWRSNCGRRHLHSKRTTGLRKSRAAPDPVKRWPVSLETSGAPPKQKIPDTQHAPSSFPKTESTSGPLIPMQPTGSPGARLRAHPEDPRPHLASSSPPHRSMNFHCLGALHPALFKQAILSHHTHSGGSQQRRPS